MKEKESFYDKEFNKIRNDFIINQLQKVMQQQMNENGHYVDQIDHKRTPIIRETTAPSQRYSFIPVINTEKTGYYKLIVGEPIFENPCSYDAVEKVLDHFLEEVGVGTSRQWAAIGCDGLPYVLASRIIEEIFVCPVCWKQFDGITEFSTHISDTGHVDVDVDDPEDGRKYKNILKVHM